MQCMKCGRDLEEDRVFCPECLEEMEKYPVKPGTVVLLPHRPPESPAKKLAHRKVVIPVEDQLRILRKWARALALALVLSVLLTLGLGYLLVKDLLEEPKLLPGQNYTSMSQSGSGGTR